MSTDKNIAILTKKRICSGFVSVFISGNQWLIIGGKYGN
jgi:hypothetical protein